MVSVPLEDVDEEWKEIWKSEYLKTISAFYNTAGGRFIVGRRDDGTFVGVQDVKGTLKSNLTRSRTSSESPQPFVHRSSTIKSASSSMSPRAGTRSTTTGGSTSASATPPTSSGARSSRTSSPMSAERSGWTNPAGSPRSPYLSMRSGVSLTWARAWTGSRRTSMPLMLV